MSNYNSLKATIDANIKQNGNQEITGQILNSVLNQMVTTLGAGYQFAGVATLDPATDPGTPDAKVFYIANGKGTYTNFGGVSVTEDEVVVLYWDSSWHKVSTGIASQSKLSELSGLLGEKADEADLATVAKTGKYTDLVGKPTTLSGYGITDAYTKTQTDELLNTKQNELTLTVKDNGNIVIGNLQGQTKEFMPATPSGDPMHYAYEAAGAEWNGTGADIVKTAPWADLADDDADKTVTHKAGYWYLNGLGDITTDEIRTIYAVSAHVLQAGNIVEVFSFERYCRTYFAAKTSFRKGGFDSCNLRAAFSNSYAIVVNISGRTVYSASYFLNEARTQYVIGPLVFTSETTAYRAFIANDLKYVKILLLSASVIFTSPYLYTKAIIFMINNENAKSAITITLHADAYARAMANADIVAALEAHPNVSLASA